MGKISAGNILYFQVMNSRQIPAEWLPQYTYQDYEKWEGDWELIFGIPYAMSPSPKRRHQQTERKAIRILEDAVIQEKGRCQCEVYHELDWIIDENTVVRPDVMIVCGDFEDDFLRFPPSLVMEITSKRTQIADRNVKFKLYESQRVPYYLIVDPERKTIDVFSLTDNEYHSAESFSFSLKEVCHIEPALENLWL
jgi:Uma2 family endonuclease